LEKVDILDNQARNYPSVKVTSTEFQQKVGRCLDEALTEPVIITKNGRDRNVLISASAFKTLVRGRIPRRMEDLDDETLQGIAAAEVPAHLACLDKIDLGGLG
jgi:prevent-host-death family protein